ncbi:MAG TPA: AMP-binding protein [Sphaerochaeta sp.]|nr:AMP-binding protein [Sphaerochaeta sp.]
MKHSWEELDQIRGTSFTGQWPTIIEMFSITIEKFPHRPCFTSFKPERVTLTYEEVQKAMVRVSSYLQQSGVAPGDRVVINGKNSPNWAIAYLAVLHAGAIVVPLDHQMPIERVQDLSSFCEASFIFGDKSVLEALDRELPWNKALKGMATLLGESLLCPSIESIEANKEYQAHRGDCEDVAAILFTSGTTGNEKGATLTHANIVSDVYQACDGIFLSLDETDVLYALLPLHHSYCCTAVLLETLKHGSECVFGQEIAVSRMIADMTHGQVTIFMGIPMLYNKILAGMMKQVRKKGLVTYALVRTMMTINGFTKKYLKANIFRSTFNKLLLSKVGLDQNRILICGAGPLSPQVFKHYQQLGLDFIQGYGLTETSPILTLNPISHFKIQSVGMVFPLVDMKIGSKNEHGIGEILVKGPNITSGYWKDEIHTKELFDEDGYLKTGDLGYLDKENYLYLKGRAKNLIITEGGKNVYPEEIEDMFQLYAQVEQVLIRGYQQHKNSPSELIEAVIYPNLEYYANQSVPQQEDLDRIIKEVNLLLQGYKKITKLTIITKPMEMTSTKKIKRNRVTA